MPRLLACLAAIAAVLAAAVAPAGGATSDPYRARQWGLDRISAEQAWTTSTGAGAVVAVIDSGVDLTHPDLNGNLVSSGADFVEPKGECSGKGRVKTCTQDGAMDENGHGTHVAGIVAAETDNGIGVAGTAPGARILPVRVLDEDGSGFADQLAAGISYAVDKGADVLSLSLGWLPGQGTALNISGELDPVYAAIDRAWAKGAVIVIAAGNETFPLCAEPSAHEHAVCVGATDENDVRSWFSNSDATLTSAYLVAPGGQGITCSGDIFSTYLRTAESFCSDEPGYEAIAGTSMAAPFVSGVAALLASKGLANTAIVNCLTSSADDLGVPGRDPVYGYGRVNAARAVSCSG